MQPTAHAIPHPEVHEAHHEELGFWSKYVFSTDHKIIGIQYGVTALFFLFFGFRSEEHTSELQSQSNLVCRLLLEKKKNKYINKKSDMDLAAKGLGAKEWHNSLNTNLSLFPKKLFRIKLSRNFGMKMLTMTNVSTECLIQLTKLGYDATPFNQIFK